MARELKIKVTPLIDKSLQKLMKAIDSTQTLKVNVDLNDGGLGKMLKSLNSISSKSVKVGLDVDGRALNGLATRLSNLTDKKLRVGVETEDSQIKKTTQALENLSQSTKSINKSSIVIDVDASQVPATAVKLQLLGYTINDISKKSVPINLESRNVLAMAKNLEVLGQDINNLNRKSVDISVDSNQIRRAIVDTDEIGDSINDINQKTISPSVDLSNLNHMAETLDDISDKILGIAGQAIEPAVDLAEDSLDLYDTQKSFQMQMSSLGMDDKSINSIMKQLNDYGAQSKYSVADMLRAYSEFRGAGNEDPMPLIKGMAGLASYGEKPNQALQALIRNMTEGNETDNVYTGDWREIRKAIGASASKQIRDWFLNNKGIELTTENFSDKMIYNGDFKQAIIDVGNQQNFQDMAQQTNTLSSAIENLKESFTVGVIGDMDNQGPMAKFTQALIKQVNDFTDAVPLVTDRLSSTLDKVMNVFGKSFRGFNAKDFLTDIFDALDSFVDYATPFIEKIGKLTNSGKDLGKFVGNIVKYAAEMKMATSGFKTVASIGDFASDFVSLGKNLKGGLFTKSSPTIQGGLSDLPTPPSDINKKVGLWSKINGGIQKGALTVSAVAGSMVLITEALKRVATADIPVDKLAINSAEIGVAMTAMSGIYFAISKFGGGIKGDVMQGAGLALSVGLSVVALAKALEFVANTTIPADKLAINATEIVVAIGAVSGIYFTLSKFGGSFTGDVAKGAGMALGIGASVVILAQAFKMVADTEIPTDKLAMNVAKIDGAIAITSLLYGIMGKLGGGLVGDITKGALIALGIAGAMVLLAKAFKTIGKIKINIEGVVDNVSTITLGVATMGAIFGGLGFALEALAPLEGFITAGIAVAGVIAGSMLLLSLVFEGIAASASRTTQALVNTGRNLNALNNMEIPSFSSLETKITRLSNDIKKIHDSTKDIGGEGLWSSIVSSLETLVDAKTAERAMQMFTDFSNYIISFNNISLPDDITPVKTKIESIKDIITTMDEAFEGIGGGGFWSSLVENLESYFDVGTAGRVIDIFRNIASFATELVHTSIPEMPKGKAGEADYVATPFGDKIQSIINIMKGLKKGLDTDVFKGNWLDSVFRKWTQGNNAQALDYILEQFNAIIAFAKNVKGVPNEDKVKKAINSIQKVFDKIGEFDFSKAQKLSKDDKKKIEDAIKAINDLTQVIDTVNNLANLPDQETVKTRMDTLKAALTEVSNFNFEGINFDNISNQEENIKTFSTFAGKLKNIATSLSEIANQNIPDNIVDILENLKQAIAKAAEIDLTGFQALNLETTKTFFEGLTDIVGSIAAMQEHADKLADIDSINTTLTNIKSIIEDVTEVSGKDGPLAKIKSAVTGFSDDGSIKVVSDFIAGISELADNILAIDEIADRFENMDAFNDAMTKIRDMFNSDGALKGLKDNIESNFKDKINTDDVTNFVNGLMNVANAILALDAIGDQFEKMNAFETGINAIDNIFKTGTETDPDALSPLLKIKKSIEENFKDELKTDNAVNFINGITIIANKLLEAQGALANIDLEALIANLDKLSGVTKDGKTSKGIFDSLAEIKKQFLSLTGLGGSTSAEAEARSDLGYEMPQVKTSGNESILNSDLAKEVTAVVQSIVDISNDLVKLQGIPLDITSIVAKTQILGNALSYIKGLGETYKDVDGKGLKNASDLVTTAINIANKLNTMPALASDVVTKITSLKTAIDELNSSGITLKSDGITSATSSIVELENSLKTLSADMTPIGKSFGTKFVNAFQTELSIDDKNENTHGGKIVNAVRKIISEISALSDLSDIGRTMASTLADGFDTLAFTNKITEIKGILQGLNGIEVDVTPTPKISGKGKKTKREHGGIIPEYHSIGGRVGSRFFKSQGTDNVPAMLTAGEYVLKRSVTSALGKGFLDKLNQMNLNGAFMALASKTGQSVVNNTTNNITQNIDNKASYVNGLADIGRVVRI